MRRRTRDPGSGKMPLRICPVGLVLLHRAAAAATVYTKRRRLLPPPPFEGGLPRDGLGLLVTAAEAGARLDRAELSWVGVSDAAVPFLACLFLKPADIGTYIYIYVAAK